MTPIINWLPPILIGFGAIALVVTALEIIVLALAISLCFSKEKKEESP